MLKGITQADARLITPIRQYGCYFLCLANASPIVFQGDEGCQLLNGIWVKATEDKIISGDLNHDGDFDDDGEAEIQDATTLAQKYFKLKVKYDGIHHPASEEIPANVKVIIGQYFWKSGHFVQINKSKKVIYDPYGKSNTVRNGYLKTMRYFYVC